MSAVYNLHDPNFPSEIPDDDGNTMENDSFAAEYRKMFTLQAPELKDLQNPIGDEESA